MTNPYYIVLSADLPPSWTLSQDMEVGKRTVSHWSVFEFSTLA